MGGGGVAEYTEAPQLSRYSTLVMWCRMNRKELKSLMSLNSERFRALTLDIINLRVGNVLYINVL